MRCEAKESGRPRHETKHTRPPSAGPARGGETPTKGRTLRRIGLFRLSRAWPTSLAIGEHMGKVLRLLAGRDAGQKTNLKPSTTERHRPIPSMLWGRAVASRPA
eukprot:scaffold3871_cov97-Isochrysis_galbana.AAC.1